MIQWQQAYYSRMTTLRFVFHDDMLGKSVCGSALREKKCICKKERTSLCVRNTSTGSPYNNFPSMYYVQKGRWKMENSTIIILGLIGLGFYITHKIFSSNMKSFNFSVDLNAGKLNFVGKFFKKSVHEE